MTPPVVLQSDLLARGSKISLRRDTVDLGPAGVVTREVVEHPGAVGVVAIDGDGRVLLVRQYRHPVADWLWELPAGLLDVDGESPIDAAARELAEEGGVEAGRMAPLIVAHTSPGMTDERIEIFLASEITPTDSDFEAEAEELEMATAWVPMAEAITRVQDGRITNAMAIMGILAAARHWEQREATQ